MANPQELAELHHQELRSALVNQENFTADPEYSLGLFTVPPSTEVEESKFCIILISEVDSKFLVAVPGAAWHRTVALRLLPPKSLIKPLSVAVAACTFEDRITSLEGVFTRCWVGYLSPTFEACVSILQDLDGGEAVGFWTEDESLQVLPFADGLVSVADDKFSFLTAESAIILQKETNLMESDWQLWRPVSKAFKRASGLSSMVNLCLPEARLLQM